MIIKTTEYLAMVRDKTGYSDYKIAKEYDINHQILVNIALERLL